LIGKPAERRERNESIRTDHYETAETMPYASKARLVTFGANAVLQNKMTAIDIDGDTVAI
jgi:hypothetical protein